MPKFSVTYDIVTPESAENGDVDEIGFICEDVSLRDALTALFETRTSLCDGQAGIGCNAFPESMADCITVDNGLEFETGARESRSLHWPKTITQASKARVIRLAKRGYV